MEHRITNIWNYEKEVCEHIDRLLENSYEESTPQETVMLGALLTLHDGLCKYKQAAKAYDKHDSHARHDHDEHEDSGRMRR